MMIYLFSHGETFHLLRLTNDNMQDGDHTSYKYASRINLSDF